MKKNIIYWLIFLTILSVFSVVGLRVLFVKKLIKIVPSSNVFTKQEKFVNLRDYKNKSRRLGRLLDSYYNFGWSAQAECDFSDVLEQLKETLVELEARNAPKKLTKRAASQILCLEKIIKKESSLV